MSILDDDEFFSNMPRFVRLPKADECNFHSVSKPHWSTLIEWRPGRWDPMSNAPCTGYPIMHVRGRGEDGKIFEPMHFAYGGGEEQPPFIGWFVPCGSGYIEVRPVEWQPIHAAQEEPCQE